MSLRVHRRNESALRWVRSGAFVSLTWWSLAALGFTPGAAAPVLAAAVGVLSLFAPGIAVLAALGILSLPVLAADLVTGVVFLIAGFASITYLAQGRGRAFLLIASAVLLAWAGPLWAVAALAGLFLGSSEGAVNALVACIALQVAALIAGVPEAGILVSGAVAPGTFIPADVPANLLSFSWLGPSISELSPEPLISVFSQASLVPLLLLQPLIWAAAAATAGLVRRSGRGDGPQPWLGPTAVAAAVTIAAALHTAALRAFDLLPPIAEVLSAFGGSIVIAVAVAMVWEYVFPPLPCAATPTRPSLSSEDADVDELLSLIARAEDELASKHTTEATVMITDMKAFSAMTEEDGSVTSAKAIQRHRDLLLPIIESVGGSGKSTGGDGLVAAFTDPSSAVEAAVRMQQALRDHNLAHSSERSIVIRTGIASGEVVLDKRGRPFIGAALNLAARIMNLGDGGQILVSRPVSNAAKQSGVRVHPHGSFELKNIAEPVPVSEVFWDTDQEPLAPRCE